MTQPLPPSPALRQSVVFHQLDDLNALGDALAAASAADDDERAATVRATMDRFIVALGWQIDAVLPTILAYVEACSRFADDLFAPAFVLAAIAPDDARTGALLARLAPEVADLVDQAQLSRCPPRP